MAAVVLAGGLSAMHATSAEVSPPTSEEAQAAYARFVTSFAGRLYSAGSATLSGGKVAEINEFAHRQPLRGCDERREPGADPFAPADAAPPPVVFNCTWENGERISLTRVANTGVWMVSNDAAAAAGAGMMLVGPLRKEPQVVAIPAAPSKAAPPDAPPDAPAVPAVAATSAPAPTIFTGANMQAMPSPFVPPARAEPVRSSTPAPAIGPMPAPYSAGGR
ncbi:hypothetical protein [Variovorax ginsengisoli]|uniref:Uncharacterized protein n=1 Tax=Variovorax ginsengisoli TaxID=363844 RepID=A0ABT8S9V8_9BURK|nr:hypothetical protein [Variovorax ginsengisoli]MDN8616535.1 hypothetical protein [Variovorax ginsengisoli]MDO1535705.1 hypothetical protein [Variovorax ginsengisoli]